MDNKKNDFNKPSTAYFIRKSNRDSVPCCHGKLGKHYITSININQTLIRTLKNLYYRSLPKMKIGNKLFSPFYFNRNYDKDAPYHPLHLKSM